MTQIEFLDWERADNHHVWVCRVSDKFGDSGLTGIMSMEVAQETAKIVDFVLSCRVMGRNVERAMVAKLWEFGRTLGVSRIEAEFIPTKKNRPCREFWLSSGFEYDDSRNLFSWKIEDDYPVPDEILVVGEYSEKIS